MYTLELYKTDARTKSGERLVEKRDGCGAMGSPLRAVELHYAKMYPAPTVACRDPSRQWLPAVT